MTVKEIYRLIDGYAPFSLSGEYCAKYSAYDNSGIIFDFGGDVKEVLCSLDFSKAAVAEGVKRGANVIFTHHPAIYAGVKRLDGVFADKVKSCAVNGISVLSAHLNMDCAKGGVDEYFAEGVIDSVGGGEVEEIFEKLSLPGCGYGRGYRVEGISSSHLVERMKRTFSTDRIQLYGGEGIIKKCVGFCGAGGNEDSIAYALSYGADAIISADFRHHVIAAALEAGLKVIALTHYASENYAFEIITKKIFSQADVGYTYHTDGDLL